MPSSGWSTDHVQDEERIPLSLHASPHAAPHIVVSPPNTFVDLPDIHRDGKRPPKSSADRHKSQKVISSAKLPSGSQLSPPASSNPDTDTAMVIAEDIAIVAAVSILATMTDSGESA
ncbi:hypothetical protein PAXRUDRAFT_830210, partial [Paxillus rubicundulus Ve08.2h10]